MTTDIRRWRFIIDEQPTWQADAACRGQGPATWFPTGEKGAQAVDDIARAKAVCATCRVTGPCLEYGLAHAMDHGVWGGASPDDRKAIRRRRNIARRQETTTP